MMWGSRVRRGKYHISDMGGINGCSSEAAIRTHTIRKAWKGQPGFGLGLGWEGERIGVEIRIAPTVFHMRALNEEGRYLG